MVISFEFLIQVLKLKDAKSNISFNFNVMRLVFYWSDSSPIGPSWLLVFISIITEVSSQWVKMDKRKNSKVLIIRQTNNIITFPPHSIGSAQNQEERQEGEEEGGQEPDWRGSRERQAGAGKLAVF